MYNFQNQLQYAVRTGLCPVCHRRPRARWKDTGALRMTCGHPVCFGKWLGRRQSINPQETVAALPILEEVVDG